MLSLREIRRLGEYRDDKGMVGNRNRNRGGGKGEEGALAVWASDEVEKIRSA